MSVLGRTSTKMYCITRGAGLVCLLGLMAAPAGAALKAATPAEVCGFMTEAGLATSGWKESYGTFTCGSPYRTIGAGALPNNLAFYAEGQRSTVSGVKLVLNVNERGGATSAHGELLKAARILCLKSTGQNLPSTLTAAIRTGKTASAKVGGGTVHVMREDWPTGKGYEVRVQIE